MQHNVDVLWSVKDIDIIFNTIVVTSHFSGRARAWTSSQLNALNIRMSDMLAR